MWVFDGKYSGESASINVAFDFIDGLGICKVSYAERFCEGS